MTDRLSEIQELQARHAAAQTAMTQAQTRREALLERQGEVVAKMEALGVTPEDAGEKLAQLIEKRDRLIAEARAKLDSVEL